ncbi:enoyl-CoA hydratase/isomerase family protein [Novosphingobium colocasiae]|uniref:enoyl-CoA hydratase/isomerase family protein n=1 Tax=Novosphingobium colocasiae TaxID=1256513 RepID=UPI0035AFBCD1
MENNDVQCFIEGRVGRLRLNRPKAINALNLNMVRDMTEALLKWREQPEVQVVIIDHADGRGFCAGGDVVSIANSATGHGAAGDAFFFQEYRMNHLMYTYLKPGVVFMDGITMGGGVGISMPCRYRVATERTVFAMPETGIGLFPDVGGGRYLSKLPGRIAQYLGLTGGRLDGAECVATGLATHYIPSERLEEVKEQILLHPEGLRSILDNASEAPPPAKVMDILPDINRVFASDRLEDTLAALEADPSEWAQKQLSILRTKSPLSCKVTLRLLVVSPHFGSFEDEMRLEFGIVHRMFRQHDFIEGVRALLIDKDNKPRWHPAKPQDVPDELVASVFQPLPKNRAWTPLPVLSN